MVLALLGPWSSVCGDEPVYKTISSLLKRAVFRKSLTLSFFVNLSLGAALAGGAAKAEIQPEGRIEFTADNASEVFLNGTSLGVSNNWMTEPVIVDVKSELKEGSNVIGVASWDTEQIAGMSGKFVMPDGTTFDTSADHYQQWRAWDAAPGIKTPCIETGCVKGADGKAWKGEEVGENWINPVNPLSLSGTDPGIDIPSDWNLPDIENLDGWVAPGQSNTGSTWTNYNTGGGWIWLGDRLTTGVDPDRSENIHG